MRVCPGAWDGHLHVQVLLELTAKHRTSIGALPLVLRVALQTESVGAAASTHHFFLATVATQTWH